MPQSSVIQGYFPHGLPRVVSTASAIQPKLAAHVAQAIGGSASAVQQRAVNPAAVPLPAHLGGFPTHGGHPLPPAVLQKMESLFGTSFADVRVHVGPQAARIGAVACTRGADIHFAPGQYEPSTARGQEILAHELTHVVQQRSGRVTNPFGSGLAVVRDPSMENEAAMRMRAATQRAPVQRKARVIQPLTATQYKKHQEGVAMRALNRSFFGITAVAFDAQSAEVRANFQAQFHLGFLTPDLICTRLGVEVPGDVFTINPSEGVLTKKQLEARAAEPADNPLPRSVRDLNDASAAEREVFTTSVRNAIDLKRGKYTHGGVEPVVLMDLSRYRNWLGRLPSNANGVYVYDGTKVTVVSC
jgi:hypothetical protein